jgi:hypothetical protein
VLDSSTTITKKGLIMSPNSLRTGMHLKISGVTRSDGSIQAQAIQIMGGGMM